MLRRFSNVIRKVTPGVIQEMNEICIPALEKAWGRPFKDEMALENQVTVEIAKNYVRPLNNTFFRHISRELPNFREHTTNGSDYILGDILIEDKNSFSPLHPGWVGNGFTKTPIHLLKKFHTNEDGRIVGVFIALVDLSRCSSSAWTDRILNSNRSMLQFRKEDECHLKVLLGDLRAKKKYLQPILQNV